MPKSPGPLKDSEIPPDCIVIDVNQIPEFRRNELADLAIALTRKVFSQPGAEERYQKWLAERKAKA